MDELISKPEDFNIRVRPQVDSNEDWTGEIDVVIITSPRNNLTDDDYYQVMHICKMISSIIPLMEKDNKLRDRVNEYVVNKLDNDYKNGITNTSEVESVEDNVIKINFKPQTRH